MFSAIKRKIVLGIMLFLFVSMAFAAKTASPTSIQSLITEEPPEKYSKNSLDNNASNKKPVNIQKKSIRTDNAVSVNARKIKESVAVPSSGVWVLADTEKSKLFVMKDRKIWLIFHDISFGRSGADYSKITQDEKTPIGKYRISWVNNKSKFKLFFGLNYPNQNDLKIAYEKGVIDYGEYSQQLGRIKKGLLPLQSTILGGNIGIHGLGSADPGIHKAFNWTMGCVALTNRQIIKLKKYIGIGTVVVIR